MTFINYELINYRMGVRKWGGGPPGKMDEKLKSENTQKRAAFYIYDIF